MTVHEIACTARARAIADAAATRRDGSAKRARARRRSRPRSGGRGSGEAAGASDALFSASILALARNDAPDASALPQPSSLLSASATAFVPGSYAPPGGYAPPAPPAVLWSTSSAAESSTQEVTQADFDRQSQDLKELSNRQSTLRGLLKTVRKNSGVRGFFENPNSNLYTHSKGLAELRRLKEGCAWKEIRDAVETWLDTEYKEAKREFQRLEKQLKRGKGSNLKLLKKALCLSLGGSHDKPANSEWRLRSASRKSALHGALHAWVAWVAADGSAAALELAPAWAGAMCPITHDDLSELTSPPPFFLPTSVDAAPTDDNRDSSWFNSLALARYFVESGDFTHPISRRAIERRELKAIDAKLRAWGHDGKARVVAAFEAPRPEPPAAGLGAREAAAANRQAQADAIRASLYGAGGRRAGCRHRAAATAAAARASRRRRRRSASRTTRRSRGGCRRRRTRRRGRRRRARRGRAR